MNKEDFQRVLDDFIQSDVSKKVEIYVSSIGLSQDQYHELLKLFPLEKLPQLEEALA